MSDSCKILVEMAEQEVNLIKKAIAYNKASQCYREAGDEEQSKLLRQKVIESFQKESSKKENGYEKALVLSYEAIVWVILGEFEQAQKVLDQIDEMRVEILDFIPPTIVEFVRFIVKKEIKGAGDLWKDIHDDFAPGIIEMLEEAFVNVHPSSEPPSVSALKLSKTWNVDMISKSKDSSEDWNLTFFDAHEIFECKLILKSSFMEDLMETVKNQEHYHFLRNVRSIKSSEGEDISDKAIIAILATSTEKNLKFGFLMGHLEDGSVHVLAIWPETLARAIAMDTDIFGAFITRLVKNPEWFIDVNLLTFLSDEKNIKRNYENQKFNEESTVGYYT